MQTDDLAAQMVREMEETPKEIAEAELIVEALRAWGPLVSSGYECPAAGQTMHVAADWIEKAIRAERAGKDGRCKCTFAQKMTGDGCDVCNPERAKDYDHDR